MNTTADPTQAGQSAFIFTLFSQGSVPAAPEYEMPAETRDARRNTRARKAERRSTSRILAPERICPRHSLASNTSQPRRKTHMVTSSESTGRGQSMLTPALLGQRTK